MPQVQWRAAPDGAYWIDLAIGSHELLVLVDLGMIDSKHRIGLSLEPALYDSIKQAGGFGHFFVNFRLDASGRASPRENGLLTAELLSPVNRQRVGPVVSTYAARGATGVPNRVGAVFFHQLAGCRVVWELDHRTWTVEYP